MSKKSNLSIKKSKKTKKTISKNKSKKKTDNLAINTKKKLYNKCKKKINKKGGTCTKKVIITDYTISYNQKEKCIDLIININERFNPSKFITIKIQFENGEYFINNYDDRFRTKNLFELLSIFNFSFYKVDDERKVLYEDKYCKYYLDLVYSIGVKGYYSLFKEDLRVKKNNIEFEEKLRSDFLPIYQKMREKLEDIQNEIESQK